MLEVEQRPISEEGLDPQVTAEDFKNADSWDKIKEIINDKRIVDSNGIQQNRTEENEKILVSALDKYRESGKDEYLRSFTREGKLRFQIKALKLYEDGKFDDLIVSAENGEELQTAIQLLKKVKGSQHEYSADELNRLIDGVYAGTTGMDEITNTFGIRNKLESIFKKAGIHYNQNIDKPFYGR